MNVETIRYYQRRGLLPKPGETGRGLSPLPAETLARLRFIKRAQELGFTLREIVELLTLGSASCRETQRLAEHKRADLDSRLRDLKAMRRTLNRLIKSCRAGGATACPIIDSLSRK